MFFFFSSTNTKERIERCNQKLADNEIKGHLSFVKYASKSRANIAKIEVQNLMITNNLSHASGSGVEVENINGNIKFYF